MEKQMIEEQHLDVADVTQIAPIERGAAIPSSTINDPTTEESSSVVVSLNEFHTPDGDDEDHSNDTVIHIEEIQSSPTHEPLDETRLAIRSNDSVDNDSAQETSSSWIRRCVYGTIHNFRFSGAVALGYLILRARVNSETVFENTLRWFRLGSFRFYRIPFRYSVSTIVPLSHSMMFPVLLNLQFGIVMAYEHRMIAGFVLDFTQNREDILEHNEYNRLMRLGNFDLYIQHINLCWNEMSGNQSRLSRANLPTISE